MIAAVGPATWMLVVTKESYAAFVLVPLAAAPFLLHAAVTVVLLLVGFSERGLWVPRVSHGLFALYCGALTALALRMASDAPGSEELARVAIAAATCFVLALLATRRRFWSDAPARQR